jgi:8-amino-7-oxononanoate synthase
MLDFTSALYLGLQHPSWSLRPWKQLTMGTPAALRSPASANAAAQQLAQLQGCEAATLGTSTLHLFWDLFGLLAQARITILVDAGTYPIARWGAERAAGRGVHVTTFAHHDADALWRELKADTGGGRRPVIVTDGFCPGCGTPAPLATYLQYARVFGGSLVLDDTQALGIFGRTPNREIPYGVGGGGMLPWSNIHGPDVLVVSSLAKAFGVPIAVMAGSRSAIGEFESSSQTRVHCSPPSIGTIHALEHALDMNARFGDRLRQRLTHLITRFRHVMAAAGFRFTGNLFPVQTLVAPESTDVVALYRALSAAEVSAVLRSGGRNRVGLLSFLITAKHTSGDVDRATQALVAASDTVSRLNDSGVSDVQPYLFTGTF